MDKADDGMSSLPPGLQQLEAELIALSDDAMTLDEFDGFIAGLLVCPDLIPPSDWLAVVWNGAPGEKSPFNDGDRLKRFFDLLMAHYNDVAVTLMERPHDYDPLLFIDTLEDRVVWELWASGFARAIELRPDAWRSLLDAGAATAAAMRGLMTLVEAACSVPPASEETYDALDATAVDDIASWVITLHQWRLAHPGAPGLRRGARGTARPAPVRNAPKIGRNDPCPCGSGRKYKKCCGLN